MTPPLLTIEAQTPTRAAIVAVALAIVAGAGVLLIVAPPRRPSAPGPDRRRRRRAARLRAAWLGLLDDAAVLVAGGHPLPTALLAAGRHAPPPLRAAFRRMRQRLASPSRGRPLELVVRELAPVDIDGLCGRLVLLHDAAPPDLAGRLGQLVQQVRDQLALDRAAATTRRRVLLVVMLTSIFVVRAAVVRELPSPASLLATRLSASAPLGMPGDESATP